MIIGKDKYKNKKCLKINLFPHFDFTNSPPPDSYRDPLCFALPFIHIYFFGVVYMLIS